MGRKDFQYPAITNFHGDNRFLSNFYPVVIEFDGSEYDSVEHAFQAAKTVNPDERVKFQHYGVTPAKAKAMGRTVSLRRDWEQVKNTIMLDLLRLKFEKYSDLGRCLIATRNAELIEGNWWGDTYWGVCNGEGENHLGKLLMQVREEIQ